MATYIDQYKPEYPNEKAKASNTSGLKDVEGLPLLPPGEELSMVLIGKTGHGKSETGNTLCNKKEFFEASDSSLSVTLKNKSISTGIGGRKLKIVDTPGCMNTKGNAVLKEIADAITTNPEGYDAFLIVVRYPARMTTEENDAIKQLEQLFGKEMYEYSVVIFTHGDIFKLRQENRTCPITFQQYIEQDMNVTNQDYLGPLLKKVSGRAVLFSNMETDPMERRKMIIELVEKIEEIREKMGKRYENKLFEKAREYAKKSENEEERSNWLYNYMLSWCCIL